MRVCRTIALAICATIMSLCPVAAIPASRDAELYIYNLMKPQFEKEFQTAVEMLNGKNPGREAYDGALGGIRMLLYNKSSIYAYCLYESRIALGEDVSRERLLAEGSSCIDERVGYLTKFFGLSEYGAVLPVRESTMCFMKARQYEREALLRPYPFLQNGDAELYDFQALTDCLLALP